MVHSFLSDQQLDEIEERYKSLQKLVTMDVEALIRDVRAYKQKANVTPSTVSNVDWAKYPMTLRPKHIEEILGRSQKSIYELLKEPPFHTVKAGREIYISKNVFRKWLEGSK
jgi:hypothetical protein